MTIHPLTRRFLPLLALLAAPLVGAQQQADEIPPDLSFLTPEINAQLEEQAIEFYEAVAPATQAAAESTVWVRSERRVLAQGTVVGDGTNILTKWSEIAGRQHSLQIVTGTGDVLPVTVEGVYADYDLAKLKLHGEPLVPIDLETAIVPPLGSFLVAARPDGVTLSVGVTGVLPRSLRESDKAYIGVQLDMEHTGPGTRILAVAEGSPADVAGLKGGDLIVGLGNEKISGLYQLQNRLLSFNPGDVAELNVVRDGEERRFQVTLGNRPGSTQFPPRRLEVMERMGGPISNVRSGFPQVLETDMFLKPNEAGGPVVDLDGHFVGITLARASRVRSFIIPAAEVVDLLDEDPIDPHLAMQRIDEARAVEEPQIAQMALPPGPRIDPSKVRRQLHEMRRLKGLIEREMERIETE